MPWEKIKSEYILNAKWLKVRKDTVKINDELVIDDYYVTENNDVVLVFPVIEKEYVILKKEYRYPLDKITQELPGGMFDGSKESALAVAKRELLEETGLNSESWINLGEFYDCPTKDTSKMHLFLANNCVQTAALLINPQEEIEPVKIGLNELEELINNNSIQVTGSMACIYKAMLYLKNSE